jgi:hypothetical protein
MHPILSALGVSKIPLGTTENEILKKVLNDHLFNQRAMELMIVQFGETVAKQMHPVEVTALLKRTGAIAPPAPTVKWEFVDMDQQTGSGVYSYCIRATFRSEVRNFPGPQPRPEVRDLRNGHHDVSLSPLTKKMVSECLAGIQWAHGGIVDRPPQEILWLFENRALSTVQQ